MEMVLHRLQAVLAGALALSMATVALAPRDARAGQYHVYGCRTPSGQAAPADGWSGSVTPNGAFDQYAKNTCAGGGALIAALGDVTTHGAYIDKATWVFSAPAGESIAAATLFRAGDSAGGGSPSFSYGFWLAGPHEAGIFDQCLFALGCLQRGTSTPLSPENRTTVPSANLGQYLFSTASCSGFMGAECPSGAGDGNGNAAVAYVFASDISLEQSSDPSVFAVAGDLASALTVRGTSSVTFTASDTGSGVYEAIVSVDGQVVGTQLLGENGGHCRSVGQTTDGKLAFLYVQPCPSSVAADVLLDTTRLTNGSHHVVVSVLDAAGNSATVLDREVTVANPPPACGTGTSSQATLTVGWKGARSTRLTTRFGHARPIVGRLTGASRAPIAGAAIEILATPAYVGTTAGQMAGAQTQRDGRFLIRLPRSVSSRELCLSYRPPGGGPAVTRALWLNVRAGIALGVSPATSSVGHEIFFHGRLLAGPVPPAGKQLVLEARSPGGPWLEFNVVRTGRRGRFQASYRFRFPGPALYQFRVLSEPESDYPFAAGASNLVSVLER